MSKNISYIIIFILVSLHNYCAAQQKSNNTFNLNGHFKNDYQGYLYLQYEDIIDSCLVRNKQFSFKGFTKSNLTTATFSSKGKITAMKKDFYLENTDIDIQLYVIVKTINNMDITFFDPEFVKGTKTIIIQNEYENFELLHKNDADWDKKNIKKIETIIEENPQNLFCGSLLASLSWNKKVDQGDLRRLYSKLDKGYQDKTTIKVIEKNLLIEKSLKIGDNVFNFQLPDSNNKLFSSSELKGKYFLLDFWSSGCAPCRREFPKLKQVYELHKKKSFEILGVSLDKSKSKWKSALEKDVLPWINVIDESEFSGIIATQYNIWSVPSNFLIDKQGKIIAINITPDELETLLTNKVND